MNLELSLVKGTDVDDMFEVLCYGKNTWCIAEFFKSIAEEEVSEFIYEVTLDNWNNFVELIEEYDSLKLRDAIHRANVYEDIEDEGWELIEEFVDALGDYGMPEQGYEWEAQTMIEWYKEDKEVRKAFEDSKKVELVVDVR